MLSRKRRLYASLLAALTVCVSGLVVHSFREAARQKRALALFSESIALGMQRTEADRRSKQACLDNLGWHYHSDIEGFGASVALIESPLTFGARNWVVYLVFEDEVIAAVLVRTADSPRIRSTGAPQDRSVDARRPWLAEFSS